MITLSSQQPIASAYFVIFGRYGDVTRHAQARGLSRQWIYREAKAIQHALLNQQQQILDLGAQLAQTRQQLAAQQKRLSVAVVLDADKQAELASRGQARGVSLADCWALVDVLIPGKGLSVATLGRRTQAAGKRAGTLLKVFDEFTKERVRDAAGDEIYVSDPVRMVVEQESLCWVSGRLTPSVDGPGWYEEFKQLPNLEQVARDGGTALKKGLALVNEDRVKQNKPLVTDQGDPFHALRVGGGGLRKAEQKASKALAAAELAQKHWQECQKRGEKKGRQSACRCARNAWKRAEKAMDAWIQLERSWDKTVLRKSWGIVRRRVGRAAAMTHRTNRRRWERNGGSSLPLDPPYDYGHRFPQMLRRPDKTKAALKLITPEGELNTRAHAEQVLAETFHELPDKDFAKVKDVLTKPEMLNYLDHVQKKIAELPFAAEVKQAAARQECLRRSPELLKGSGPSAAALRGGMLACMVVLSKSGEGVGSQAVAAVREIFRRAYRASSLVECINSVLRMQQSRHRKMTQGLLDLKRLYWNHHTFRTGRRRGTTPYQRLGVPWPEGMSWWDVLKLTPEQLRDKLSTTKQAA